MRLWRLSLGPWTYGTPAERVALLVGLAASALLFTTTPPALRLCLSGPAFRQAVAGLDAGFRTSGVQQMLEHMALMSLAMAAPLARHGLAHVRRSTFASAQGRASAAFLSGYGLPWAGSVLFSVLIMASLSPQPAASSRILIGLGALAAILWHFWPGRTRILARCHRTDPLPAGQGMPLAAFAYGVRQGNWCALACSVLMLVLALYPSAAFSVAATLLLIAERERLPGHSGRYFAVYFVVLAGSAWLSA